MQKILKEFWGYTLLFFITCLPALANRLVSHQDKKLWYDALHKPFFTPPLWVFAIVWPVLYFFMATAAWIVWRKHQQFLRKELIWYYVQLGVNAIWSPLFFGAHLLCTSMIWSYVLFTLVIITTKKFFQVDKAAGNLLLPYTLWCGFACIMSSCIWFLN